MCNHFISLILFIIIIIIIINDYNHYFIHLLYIASGKRLALIISLAYEYIERDVNTYTKDA